MAWPFDDAFAAQERMRPKPAWMPANAFANPLPDAPPTIDQQRQLVEQRFGGPAPGFDEQKAEMARRFGGPAPSGQIPMPMVPPPAPVGGALGGVGQAMAPTQAGAVQQSMMNTPFTPQPLNQLPGPQFFEVDIPMARDAQGYAIGQGFGMHANSPRALMEMQQLSEAAKQNPRLAHEQLLNMMNQAGRERSDLLQQNTAITGQNIAGQRSADALAMEQRKMEQAESQFGRELASREKIAQLSLDKTDSREDEQVRREAVKIGSEAAAAVRAGGGSAQLAEATRAEEQEKYIRNFSKAGKGKDVAAAPTAGTAGGAAPPSPVTVQKKIDASVEDGHVNIDKLLQQIGDSSEAELKTFWTQLQQRPDFQQINENLHGTLGRSLWKLRHSDPATYRSGYGGFRVPSEPESEWSTRSTLEGPEGLRMTFPRPKFAGPAEPYRKTVDQLLKLINVGKGKPLAEATTQPPIVSSYAPERIAGQGKAIGQDTINEFLRSIGLK